MALTMAISETCLSVCTEGFLQPMDRYCSPLEGYAECVMYDVIKICHKGRMRGEVGKETPKKRWIKDVFL